MVLQTKSPKGVIAIGIFLFFGAIVAALAGTMLVMLARALPMPPSSAGVSMGRYAAAQQVTSSHHRYLGTIEVPMGSTEH
jgi:hypothetical protein